MAVGQTVGIGRARLAAFIFPAAPLMALTLPAIVFLPPYYTTYLGIDEAFVGALFLAARAFDLIANPMIGALQDRTRIPLGRRRAWLILATPVLMAAVYGAFIAMKPGAPAMLAGMMILSMYLAFATMMIAHLGWAGEISDDYHGRTVVLGAVQGASVIGQVAILALPAIVQTAGLGDFDDGVRIMGWTIIAALPLTVAVCVLATPERDVPAPPKLPADAAFRALRENPALRRVLIPDFLLGVVNGVAGSLFVFYVRHVLALDRQAELGLLIYFVAGLAGVPLWVMLGRWVGKHRALQWSCYLWAFALALLPFAPRGDFAAGAVILALAGISASAGTMLLRAMMADVADADELATGAKRHGLFYGLLLTTGKLGLAFGPATYIILSAFGFDAELGAGNSQTALNALAALFIGGPILLNLLTALSLVRYPLDEARQRALRAEIDARAGAAPPA